MKYNIKSFWNGTVMSDIDMSEEEYDKTVNNFLESEYFPKDELEAMVYMNQREEELYQSSMKNGYVEMDLNEMFTNMLIINGLVKRGLVENDDKYGLLFMKFEDKRKSVKRKKKYGYE